jgi:hypothetical protein
MPKYQYPDAHSWLQQAVEKGDVKVHELLVLINQNVSGEQIEDHFQSSMDKDGYYQELDVKGSGRFKPEFFDWGDSILEGYTDGTRIKGKIVPFATKEQLERWADEAGEDFFFTDDGQLFVPNATRLDLRQVGTHYQAVTVEIEPEELNTEDGVNTLYDLSPLVENGCWTWVIDGEETEFNLEDD